MKSLSTIVIFVFTVFHKNNESVEIFSNCIFFQQKIIKMSARSWCKYIFASTDVYYLEVPGTLYWNAVSILPFRTKGHVWFVWIKNNFEIKKDRQSLKTDFSVLIYCYILFEHYYLINLFVEINLCCFYAFSMLKFASMETKYVFLK